MTKKWLHVFLVDEKLLQERPFLWKLIAYMVQVSSFFLFVCLPPCDHFGELYSFCFDDFEDFSFEASFGLGVYFEVINSWYLGELNGSSKVLKK